MVATSITINVVTSTINVATSINKRLSTCRLQIADSQQWCGLKDAILHLQLPIVYLIWCLLRHCRTLRRRLEAAADCWRGPQYDWKCSLYFKCYFFRTTPTNRDLREKAVYFPPRVATCQNLFDTQHSPVAVSHIYILSRLSGVVRWISNILCFLKTSVNSYWQLRHTATGWGKRLTGTLGWHNNHRVAANWGNLVHC